MWWFYDIHISCRRLRKYFPLGRTANCQLPNMVILLVKQHITNKIKSLHIHSFVQLHIASYAALVEVLHQNNDRTRLKSATSKCHASISSSFSRFSFNCTNLLAFCSYFTALHSFSSQHTFDCSLLFDLLTNCCWLLAPCLKSIVSWDIKQICDF